MLSSGKQSTAPQPDVPERQAAFAPPDDPRPARPFGTFVLSAPSVVWLRCGWSSFASSAPDAMKVCQAQAMISGAGTKRDAAMGSMMSAGGCGHFDVPTSMQAGGIRVHGLRAQSASTVGNA